MCSIEKKINENIHSNTFNTYPLKNGMYIFQKLSLLLCLYYKTWSYILRSSPPLLQWLCSKGGNAANI